MAKRPSKTTGIGPSPYNERRYEVEDAARTLLRAEQVKKDKGLMREVQKMAAETARAAGAAEKKGKR